MAKICKKCGNQLKDTSKFCSKCGTPYVDEPSNQESVRPTANVPPKAAAPSVQSPVTSVNLDESAGKKGSVFKYVKWLVVIGVVGYLVLSFFSGDSGKSTTATGNSIGSNNTKATAHVTDSAENTLINFHKAITAKQYKEAYNLLSSDMQSYVGGYDKFVRGYGTTESSQITEINVISKNDSAAQLAYMLESKDKFKAGILVQHFSGTAKLVNNGGWKISEITAKKVDERLSQDTSNNNSTASASNVRDPAHFGAMDKVFLGKWKRDNPHNPKDPSSITIKEANPQTGGYEVEVFFYRIADAKGYATIDGNKLSFNEGAINGNFKFGGTIEKTSRGIRLTITESGFEYVKKGSVYDYKKN